MPSPSFTVSAEAFGHLPEGAVHLYTLQAPGGLRVGITDFGAAITSLHAQDAQGRSVDVVLGYDTFEGFLGGHSCFGATVGRYANRIAGASFALDGREYRLAANDGAHHLHGGPGGFHRRLWTGEALAEAAAVRLTRLSPDGEEGYPGNLRVEVRYSLADAHTLRLDYHAETDLATPLNLTNHAFFNLAGHQAGSILEHELTLFAERFTPVDRTLIPTGERQPVAGTPLDFRTPRRVGERIETPDDQLVWAKGYDHNYILAAAPRATPQLAARVRDPQSGRIMEVLTTEPGIQFYSGNFLDGREIGRGGVACRRRSALCLETQHFPDSPHHPEFPSTILSPGAPFRSTTLFRFSAG